jgi:AbrB family looped-hinge helix DNA binding protein
MARAKVTRNYQVTIPEEVRRKVKLNEGDTVEIDALDSEQVIIKRLIPLNELRGAWANDPSIDAAMQEVKKLWKSWRPPKESA